MKRATMRKKRIIIARALGYVMFALAIVAWLYLYFGMPFTGILDAALQMCTWLIGILGFSMAVAEYPLKKRKRH